MTQIPTTWGTQWGSQFWLRNDARTSLNCARTTSTLRVAQAAVGLCAVTFALPPLTSSRGPFPGRRISLRFRFESRLKVIAEPVVFHLIISNRSDPRLELPETYTKQRTDTLSNRHKFTHRAWGRHSCLRNAAHPSMPCASSALPRRVAQAGVGLCAFVSRGNPRAARRSRICLSLVVFESLLPLPRRRAIRRRAVSTRRRRHLRRRRLNRRSARVGRTGGGSRSGRRSLQRKVSPPKRRMLRPRRNRHSLNCVPPREQLRERQADPERGRTRRLIHARRRQQRRGIHLQPIAKKNQPRANRIQIDRRSITGFRVAALASIMRRRVGLEENVQRLPRRKEPR